VEAARAGPTPRPHSIGVSIAPQSAESFLVHDPDQVGMALVHDVLVVRRTASSDGIVGDVVVMS
jgi:hypothetical protein